MKRLLIMLMLVIPTLTFASTYQLCEIQDAGPDFVWSVPKLCDYKFINNKHDIHYW